MSHEDINNPGEGHRQLQGQNQIRRRMADGSREWRVATESEVTKAGPGIYPAVMSQTDFLLEIFGGGGEESKKAPEGWFTTTC